MRLLIAVLCAVLVVLQYQLWLAESGLRATWTLQAEVASTTLENEQKAARNAALEAEVRGLKQGLDAVEERARSELGMIGQNETFYLITRAPVARSATPQ